MQAEREIVEIIKRLYKNKLTTSSGGNVSIIDNKGTINITPSAIDKSNLISNDIVKIYKSGNIKGKHKPSSEYLFHTAIYKNCPAIKAIIHAHPPFIISYCITKDKIYTNIQPDIYDSCGEIGYVPYLCPGSKELAIGVANEFKKGFSIVMLQNHGVIVGATSVKEAYRKLVMLNICAETSILAKQLGNINLLTPTQIELSKNEKIPLIKSNSLKKNYYNQKADLLRLFVARALTQNLLSSRLGSISLKINADTTMISKKDAEWEILKNKDLFIYEKNKITPASNNNQTELLFRTIYQYHPEINCIIHSYAPACFAFSISNKTFNSKTVPESNIILREAAYANYEDYYTKHMAISDLISESNPLIFLKNNGLIITGNTIFQAFDRLEVAEFTAKSIINAQKIGNINAISDEEIKKIKSIYFELDN